MWLTDTCYRNKRLINSKSGAHPVFLGLVMLHFTKDEAIGVTVVKIKFSTLKDD